MKINSTNSYQQILRSSSIIGGAAVINIVVGLLRSKVAALLLGPVGVGLIGLVQNLMTTAASAAALGFGTVGTRQIAEACGKGDESAVETAKNTLYWGTLFLALLGGLIFFLFRKALAIQVLNDASWADGVGWLSIGVALAVVAGSQSAYLNGLRRIGDLARLNIASAIVSTVLGVLSLLLWEGGGILLFVLSLPAARFMIGYWYINKIRQRKRHSIHTFALIRQCAVLARSGVPFMLSGVVMTLGLLLLRTLVQRDLGPGSLGQFQAAWMISMTYISFVLGAMGTDYYPRLAGVINDRNTATRLVNEQTEVALILSGPVLVSMLALAPWVVKLLYSGAFEDSVLILRWQVLGDVLKVTSWPMGFIILAAGDGRAFLFAETLAISVFVLFAWIFLPHLGIQATGVGFFVMYVIQLPVVYWLAQRRIGFSWETRVSRHFVALALVASLVFVSARLSILLSVVFGMSSSIILILYGLGRLGSMADFSGPVGKISALCRRLMAKSGAGRN